MTQFAKFANFEKMKNTPPPPPLLDYKIAPKTKYFDRGLSLERDPTFAEKSDRHTHTHTHFKVVDSTEVEKRSTQLTAVNFYRTVQPTNKGINEKRVADNADHNGNTLDGKGTFHLMGIIECSTFSSLIYIEESKEMLKS